MATTFRRARSDEQRALRSQAILETAAAMLEEMAVADLSLNELSRRVGLAKSNVLRYFDSREAVLLELLVTSAREWIARLAEQAPAAVSRRAAFKRRAEQLASAVTGSLVDRPVLCDLMSAQAAVLEHNVSAEAVRKYKLASMADAVAQAAVNGYTTAFTWAAGVFAIGAVVTWLLLPSGAPDADTGAAHAEPVFAH